MAREMEAREGVKGFYLRGYGPDPAYFKRGGRFCEFREPLASFLTYCIKPREEEKLIKISQAHNQPGHNPLQFSPANAEISKLPQHCERYEAAHNAKEQKSGPGKTKKGHKIGTRFRDEIKDEPGL